MSITTLLMRNFMIALPSGLREAAIVDGAGEWSVLLKVIVPLSLPALAVLATLQFTWIWNDFLWPLVFTRSQEAKTVMAGINALKGQYNVAGSAQAAMAVIASIPTVVVFIVFQRYFIAGLTLGPSRSDIHTTEGVLVTAPSRSSGSPSSGQAASATCTPSST